MVAAITSLQSGVVSEAMGKVNWHLPPGAPPPGGQSIYESSTVQLADLGQRLVVGDRVFRYAQLGAIAAIPGDLLQMIGTGLPGGDFIGTAGASDATNSKFFTLYSTTNRAVNFFADGYVWSHSGTAANVGRMYRIRSHASLNTGSNGTLVLYDALQLVPNTADKWSAIPNKYKSVTQNTAGTVTTVGVLIAPATTSDYTWIQTWGPCPVKAQTAPDAGGALYAAATGAAKGFIATGTGGTVFAQLGTWFRVPTASETELAFLTIEP